MESVEVCECPGAKKRKLDVEPPTLPVEIWIGIFERLSAWQLLRVRLVCQRWRDIVDGSRGLVAKFTVRFVPQFIDREYQPGHLFPAAKVFMKQVKIAAVGCWWVPFGAYLTDITLDECKIMLRNLLTMLRVTPNLKYLNLYDASVECHEANPVPDFRLDKLETLCIDSVNREENLEVFRQICPNVKNLKIVTNYTSFHDQLPFLRHVVDFVGVWNTSLEQLETDGVDLMLIELTQLPQWNLKGLILQGSAISCGPELDEIGLLLPKLTNLMLTFKHRAEIQPTFLTPLAAGLRILKLSAEDSEFQIINFAGLECPHLKSLDLNGIHFDGHRLQTFLAGSPKLRILSLTSCNFCCWRDLFRAIGTCKRLLQHLCISRVTVSQISSDHGFLDYLDEMRHLGLSGSKMSQEMVCTLLRLCPRLEVLHLQAMQLTDAEVVHVLCQKLRHLVRVKIENCAISEQAINSIRQGCVVQQKLEIIEF
ncbi:hypothetical protein quinque_015072 [Culex quinquefasciatus]